MKNTKSMALLDQVMQAPDAAFTMAQNLASSHMVPTALQNRPNDVFAVMCFGQQIGLPVLASVQNIFNVHGSIGISAKSSRALILQSGLCEYIKDEIITDENEGLKCIVKIKRKGINEMVGEFSMADARQAGLLDLTKKGKIKDNWRLYPKDALLHRAETRAFNKAFSDITCGLSIAEAMDEHGSIKNITSEPESRVNEIKSEIVDDKSLETEIIIDDQPDESNTEPETAVETQTVEPDPPQDDSKALKELLTNISIAKTIGDLSALDNWCKTFPVVELPKIRKAYAERLSQFKKPAEKPIEKKYEACCKCSIKDSLATCPICNKDYCSAHWGIDNEACEACLELVI